MKQIITMPLLEGTWYIVQTSLPLWLKGDKLNPVLNYSLVEKNESQFLSVEVRYTQRGKVKLMEGREYPHPAKLNTYRWKPTTGIRSLFAGKWEVCLADPEGQWAVSWFSGTPLTAKGITIISRQPKLPADTLNNIKQAILQVDKLKPYVDIMRYPPSSN